RRVGRLCRVLFAQRQLALQIRDLLLGIRDLPLLFGDLFGLTVDLLFPFSQLSAKPFVLPFQVARPQVAMPRTHPPYGSRSRAICPAKSAGVLELLQKSFVSFRSGCVAWMRSRKTYGPGSPFVRLSGDAKILSQIGSDRVVPSRQ